MDVEATLRFARARKRGRVPYTMSLAERLLIGRLKERDPSAFDEIVRRYGDKVFSLIYRMLGNRQEAEDVAQEVFITVFKTVDGFRGEAKFSTWLLRIAANAMADRWQRVAREQGEPPPEPPDEAAAEDIERRALLYQLVDTLPADQRRVVVARFVEEKSIRDLAQELGRTEGAVKQLQFRALQTLRTRTHPPSKPGAPGGGRAHA